MMLVPSTSELREQAHEALLNGLVAGQPLAQIESEVGRSRVRGLYAPDIAMLELIVAALDVAGTGPEAPLATQGWRERYLPELTWRNNHHEVERLVYALQTAAAFRTGLQPSILDDTYGWSTTPLWPYATRAAVMTIRAISDGRDIAEVCRQIRSRIPALEQGPEGSNSE